MHSEARRRIVDTVSPLVPIAYMCWPVGDAPSLPWAVYTDDPDGMGADMECYSVSHSWDVELYERESDSSLEKAVYDALSAQYGHVEPPVGTWVESEGCYMCSYRFSEIEGI